MTARPSLGARLAAWTALLCGVSVSLTGNIAHARPDTGPRLLAAVTPIALAVLVEVLVRVPWQRGWRSLLAQALTLGVGAVAAVVSYSHLHALAIRYGETGLTAALTPLAVDGLAAGGALAVVEVGRAARSAATLARTAADLPAPTAALTGPVTRTAGQQPDPDPDPDSDPDPDGPRLELVPGFERGQDRAAGGPDPLLPAARACARTIVGRGHQLNRSTLAAELRGRGHRLATNRAGKLLIAVRVPAGPERTAL